MKTDREVLWEAINDLGLRIRKLEADISFFYRMLELWQSTFNKQGAQE